MSYMVNQNQAKPKENLCVLGSNKIQLSHYDTQSSWA
jgi:hypothetical protein